MNMLEYVIEQSIKWAGEWNDIYTYRKPFSSSSQTKMLDKKIMLQRTGPTFNKHELVGHTLVVNFCIFGIDMSCTFYSYQSPCMIKHQIRDTVKEKIYEYEEFIKEAYSQLNNN